MSMDIHPSTPMVWTQQLETNYTQTFNPNAGEGGKKLLELGVVNPSFQGNKCQREGTGLGPKQLEEVWLFTLSLSACLVTGGLTGIMLILSFPGAVPNVRVKVYSQPSLRI